KANDLSRLHFSRVVDYLTKYRRAGAKAPDYDNMKKEKLAVLTTPDNAVAILKEYEKIGVTHVICMVNFGGLPMAGVRQTLELMSKHVMPALA
ncbi:MAG TPA: hypothetical protein VHV54_14435, partial [Candidatus Binatia bacterium]|nr:hypothetical protein [Candidatus Binatia bacterium]